MSRVQTCHMSDTIVESTSKIRRLHVMGNTNPMDVMSLRKSTIFTEPRLQANPPLQCILYNTAMQEQAEIPSKRHSIYKLIIRNGQKLA